MWQFFSTSLSSFPSSSGTFLTLRVYVGFSFCEMLHIVLEIQISHLHLCHLSTSYYALLVKLFHFEPLVMPWRLKGCFIDIFKCWMFVCSLLDPSSSLVVSPLMIHWTVVSGRWDGVLPVLRFFFHSLTWVRESSCVNFQALFFRLQADSVAFRWPFFTFTHFFHSSNFQTWFNRQLPAAVAVFDIPRQREWTWLCYSLIASQQPTH